MKKRFVTCAAGLGILCVFLSIGWNARNAHTPREDHDAFTDITSTPSAESALPSNCDTLMGGLQTKDSWHSENRHWVALYQTSAGETVIRVSSAQEKDAVLQELPVDLPGEILGISGFFTSCGSGTTDRLHTGNIPTTPGCGVPHTAAGHINMTKRNGWFPNPYT